MNSFAFANGGGPLPAASIPVAPVAVPPATLTAAAFSHPSRAPAPDFPDHPAGRATLLRPFAISGRGLHTGRRSTVTVRPAPPGTGIVFRRDGPAGPAVAAVLGRRVSRPLCTSLAFDDGRIVRTVEHLLAALSAYRIDDAVVEIAGEEVPIRDGSALPWCRAIAEAGRAETSAPRRYIRVVRPVLHREGGRSVLFEPADRLVLDVAIALIGFGPLRWRGEVTPDGFTREIAPSRSFGRLKWALPAKLYGLVTGRPLLRGADWRSTAVICGGRVLGGSTVPDEPVRHRALDLVGDLSLAGMPLLAEVTARDPGHEINAAALRALLDDRDAWEIASG